MNWLNQNDFFRELIFTRSSLLALFINNYLPIRWRFLWLSCRNHNVISSIITLKIFEIMKSIFVPKVLLLKTLNYFKQTIWHKNILRYLLVIWNYHGNWSKQRFKIIWQFLSSSISRICRYKYPNFINQFYGLLFKVKLRNLMFKSHLNI